MQSARQGHVGLGHYRFLVFRQVVCQHFFRNLKNKPLFSAKSAVKKDT